MMKRILALLKSGWLLAAMLVFLPLTASAQLTPTPDWTLSNPDARGAMIALDGGNNAYVAGSATGPVILLTKVSPSGVQLWQRGFDNAGALSRSTWVTVDGAGNAIVTGYVTDTIGTPVGSVVLKYDAAGTLLWQAINPTTFGYAARADADSAGNVYALARLVQPGGNAAGDVAVIKYSPAGVFQWMRTFGANFTSSEAMAITSTGNVIVTGSTVSLGLMAAFDPAGNLIWSASIPASSSIELSVVVGLRGEFYVVGGPSFGFQVAKYDAAFNLLWRNTYPASGPATRAAVDSAGNLVVTGAVDVTPPCPPGFFCTQSVIYGLLTLKLDPIGTLLWSNTYRGSSSTVTLPYPIVMGSDGAAYITGGGQPTTVGSVQSTVTLKYDALGSLLWSANQPPVTVISFSTPHGLGVRLSTHGGVLVLSDSPQTVFRYAQSGIPNQPPIAVALASPSAGTAPLSVKFSSTGSADPDGSIAGYLWRFGDGQTSTAANPSHTYAVGSYIADLTVTDNMDAVSTSAPITITANAPPPAQPTSLTLAKSTVSGGNSTTATVTVSSTAGVTLALASSNSAVASVPATVVVAAGATRATFTVKTSRVRRDTVVTLTATANGATATVSLKVRAN